MKVSQLICLPNYFNQCHWVKVNFKLTCCYINSAVLARSLSKMRYWLNKVDLKLTNTYSIDRGCEKKCTNRGTQSLPVWIFPLLKVMMKSTPLFIQTQNHQGCGSGCKVEGGAKCIEQGFSLSTIPPRANEAKLYLYHFKTRDIPTQYKKNVIVKTYYRGKVSILLMLMSEHVFQLTYFVQFLLFSTMMLSFS